MRVVESSVFTLLHIIAVLHCTADVEVSDNERQSLAESSWRGRTARSLRANARLYDVTDSGIVAVPTTSRSADPVSTTAGSR